MMTVDEIKSLTPGDLVCATIAVSGGICLEDGGEIEVELPAGAVGVVGSVRQLGAPQGWAVDVSFDNGIVNTFDEADADAFPLEPVVDTPEGRRQRVTWLSRYSPPDYPVEELLCDMLRILAPPPKPAPKPPATPRLYKVGIRGTCSAYLVVLATGVEEAEDEAERQVKRRIADDDLRDLDCDFYELDGGETEAVEE